MKKIFFMIALLSFPSMTFAWGNDVQVDGYTRSDGSYVQPHYRSSPDGNPYNNWSSQGNTNPYTGQMGTQHRNGPSSYDLNRGGSNHLGGMDSGRQSRNPAMRTY